MGYDTLDLFYKNNDKKTVQTYKYTHTNCCGLTKKGEESLKDKKKKLRKEKRKKYREDKKGKKKEEDIKNGKKKEEDKEPKKLIGRKYYRGRRKMGKK
jgi:hypothetical protein